MLQWILSLLQFKYIYICISSDRARFTNGDRTRLKNDDKACFQLRSTTFSE